MKTTYRATAVRQGRWWAVEIHGLANVAAFTQGRDLAEAEVMARDAVAAALDVPIDDIAVELVVEGTDDIVDAARQAVALRDAAEVAAQTAMRQAARDLVAHGATHRDAARVLGLSHQRISQILVA